MGEWKKVKLGDCIKEVVEKTTENNQYEVLTSSKDGIVSQEEYFDKQVASKNNVGYKIIKKGQFTYRSMSDSGSFTINKLDNKDIGIVSPAYPVFEAEKINTDYLKYFFDSEMFRRAIHNLSQGSTRTALKYKDLVEIEMLLPTIEEQIKIVKILEKVDLIIKKYERLLKEKNQFIKSQFVKMFGSINERVKMSECCKKITDYVASGSFASLHENVKTYDTENYAMMVKTADFANGFTKGLTYTDEQGYNFLHNSNLYGGELLLSNIGASIGKVHRVPKLAKKMTLAPNSIMIITNESYLEDYLQYYFLSDEGQKVLKSMETATAMPKFNKTQLKNIKIPKAELNEQLKFSKLIQLIDKQKFELEKIIENYKNLKKGLMQQLLTGKIKVKI